MNWKWRLYLLSQFGFFHCCDKDHVQKQLEEERVYFTLKLPQSIVEGSRSTWAECSLHTGFLGLFSYTLSDHEPMGSTADGDGGLGPPKSIINLNILIELPSSQMSLACHVDTNGTSQHTFPVQ